MLMYAIAEKDCWDCFYDFELNTYGDGLYTANLLPTRRLAETLIKEFEIPCGVIIEVEVNYDEEGTFFEYKNIWSK